MESSQTKTFKKGVVSYSTFLDLVDSMGGFVEDVNFLVDVAFSLDAWEKSMPFIHDQAEKAKKELSEIEEKALKESEKNTSNEDTKKEKSIFDDSRFWMYIIQIRLDGHDPVDILENWLKEHNPDFFNDEI